jgi:hypothetical protein
MSPGRFRALTAAEADPLATCWPEPPVDRLTLARLVRDHPHERNVFLATRFPRARPADELPDPLAGVIVLARHVCASHGLELHLASDRQRDDDLHGNVFQYSWACRYGIALFEDLAAEGVNGNVLTEVGAMVSAGRRCALLKDSALPFDRIPSNLRGRVHKELDFKDLRAVARELHAWIANDLALGRCGLCEPPVG